MLFSLIGTLVLGVASASVVFIVFRVFRMPRPRWIMPAVAGSVMLAFTIQSDYRWARSTEAGLPTEYIVVGQYGNTSFLRPWSYYREPVSRLQILGDHAPIEAAPHLVDAYILLMQRYEQTIVVRQLFDCTHRRRADVPSDQSFADDGTPIDPDWVDLDPDNGMLIAACAAAEPATAGQ